MLISFKNFGLELNEKTYMKLNLNNEIKIKFKYMI